MADKGNISVTAQYTSWTWQWGKLPCAELLASPEAKGVFQATNAFLGLTRPFQPRRPSLPHSLVQRHLMIDHCLAQSQATQVIELAAGLSRRGAHFSADPELLYTEVDLPHMMARKRELLARSAAGQEVLARSNLKLVAADVAQLDLDALLAAQHDTLIIAEGLLMYLDAEEQRALWKRIASALRKQSRASALVFDLVPAVEEPAPGVVGRMLGGLMKLFTQGQGFARDQRSRDDIRADLGEAGFDEVELFEPQQVASDWNLPFSDVRTQQLLFRCRTSASR